MITDNELRDLSEFVGRRLSAKRFAHTKGVEDEIVRMGEIFLPDQIRELRAAALLHDVAKELPTEEQIAICREHGDPELETAIASPAILHGHAASYLIPQIAPKYDLPEIISAIYKHTTGSEKMSTFDKLLFLADYIEPNRPWTHCIDARRRFWDGLPDEPSARLRFLDLTVLEVLSFTLRYLKDRGISPDPATERAAAALRASYPNENLN